MPEIFIKLVNFYKSYVRKQSGFFSEHTLYTFTVAIMVNEVIIWNLTFTSHIKI